MVGSGADPPAAVRAGGSDATDAAVKVVEWEDLQQELARLWSLSSALKKAKERKEALAQILESVIQGRNEYLCQSNEIEGMRQKLEGRKLMMDDLLLRSKQNEDSVKGQTEQLCVEIRSLLVASKMLSASRQQVQEANKLLAGEGHGHLQNLQKMVRARQQYMVAQVSALYPVKASMEQSSGVTVDVNGSESGDRAGLPSSNLSKISQRSSFTIFGLQLSTPPLKKTSFFGDKKELQRSATALGYVAHDVEQLLNYIGAQSLGPRHVLPNLKELMKIIHAEEYIDK